MKLAWGFLALALVFSQNLRADIFPSEAKSEWARYFPGDPLIPDPEVNLDKLITTPDDRCKPIQRSVVVQVIAYGRKAFDSDKSGSEKQAQATLNLLHQLEDSGNSCFDSVARTYLAATLHLLDPSNSNNGANFNNPRIDGRPQASNLQLTLLGAALVNHHRADGSAVIQFLTPRRRTQGMTPVWDQKTGGGKDYLVSAGYDCTAQGILIDPYLMPLDLGATFVHEMDHLFRDRVSFVGYDFGGLAFHIAEAQALLDGVDIKKAFDNVLQDHISLHIAMDETLASVVSAFFQRHMQWFHDYKPALLPGLQFWHNEKPLPFRLSADLTLFRDGNDSPMNEIWSLLEKANPKRLGTEVNPTAGFFLSQTFLRKGLTPSSNTPDLTNAPLADIRKIYQTIHQGYFGGASIDDSDFPLLDPSVHGFYEDPFSFWLDHYLVAISDDNAWTIPAKNNFWITEVPRNEYFGSIGPNENAVVHIIYDLDPYFQGLDFAFKQLFGTDQPSPYCAQYLQGLEDGELSSYVGNGLSSGFKPGAGGVKPGAGGVKPGAGGVKPGAGGVKPELIRPCLNIGRQL